jgi:transposase
MDQLTKEDLTQMDRDYLHSLGHEILIDVACRLRDLSIELLERLDQDSSNSSRPPSSDNPFARGKEQGNEASDGDDSAASDKKRSSSKSKDTGGESDQKRSAGKQPGDPGIWRSEPLKAEQIVLHYPDHCAACGAEISVSDSSKPHMGHFVLELEKTESGFRVVCSLHHYYSAECECGHEIKARPGEGYVSSVEGRKNDLKLQEYVLVGPMLATLIASLAVRYRMSRRKIQEFLQDWTSTSLSIGTIDRCVREAGIACIPVVDQLINDLQDAEILHVDETPWYEAGRFLWLWVVITANIAVYHIGSRKKEEFLKLVTDVFVGWLITDGYGAYRSYEKRQRCLAHLIRKAIGLAEGVYEKGQDFGTWVLKDLRGDAFRFC